MCCRMPITGSNTRRGKENCLPRGKELLFPRSGPRPQALCRARPGALTATPAQRGGLRAGGRRRRQATSPPPHSPCAHLEGRPGPEAGDALLRGPSNGPAAASKAAAAPPSPWKRGVGPHRGHADLQTEEGTARPRGCGRAAALPAAQRAVILPLLQSPRPIPPAARPARRRRSPSAERPARSTAPFCSLTKMESRRDGVTRPL